jgi:hypothetical protein
MFITVAKEVFFSSPPRPDQVLCHPVLYLICTGRLFTLGIKRPLRKAGQSLPYRAEVNNAWSYTSIRLHDVVLS